MINEYIPPERVKIETGKRLSPTLGNELIDAGLIGLPLSWGEDGVFEFDEGALSPEQITKLQEVVSNHNG